MARPRSTSSSLLLRAAVSRPASGLLAPRQQRAALRSAVSAGQGSPRTALADDTGAATAEYAIATMAAVGFASLLVVILRSEEVRGILTGLVRTALTVGG